MTDQDLQKIWNDPERLREWTLAELARRDHELNEHRPLHLHYKTASPAETRRHMAIWHASMGNLTPLRQLYPEFAEYINAPPRKRGRKSNPFAAYAMFNADMLAREIRKLWAEVFGRSYRKDALHLEIAAGPDPTMLLTYRSNATRKKK